MKIVDNTNNIKEAVDVGVEQHSEKLHLCFVMKRKNDSCSFDYSVKCDEDGQLVFTPDAVGTKFVDVYPRAGYDATDDIVDGNTRNFSVDVDAVMLSDDDNYDWFYDIDDIGQAIICPDSEDTSFITASVDKDLNLVTNESLEEDAVICEEVSLCDLLKDLSAAVSNLQSVVDRIRACCPDCGEQQETTACEEQPCVEQSRDVCDESTPCEENITEVVQAVVDAVSDVVDDVEIVFAVPEQKPLEESLVEKFDEEKKLNLIDRFMKGDVTIIQADKVPEGNTIIRVEELDDKNSSSPCEFYYDVDADVVVCVNRHAEG